MRPDRRSDPVAFHAYVAGEYKHWSDQYANGHITEAVYRATLHALGWRGQDITTEVNLNAPKVKHWLDRRGNV